MPSMSKGKEIRTRGGHEMRRPSLTIKRYFAVTTLVLLDKSESIELRRVCVLRLVEMHLIRIDGDYASCWEESSIGKRVVDHGLAN